MNQMNGFLGNHECQHCQQTREISTNAKVSGILCEQECSRLKVKIESLQTQFNDLANLFRNSYALKSEINAQIFAAIEHCSCKSMLEYLRDSIEQLTTSQALLFEKTKTPRSSKPTTSIEEEEPWWRSYIGKKIHKWTVLEYNPKKGAGSKMFIVQCICGKKISKSLRDLVKGISKGCSKCRILDANGSRIVEKWRSRKITHKRVPPKPFNELFPNETK